MGYLLAALAELLGLYLEWARRLGGQTALESSARACIRAKPSRFSPGQRAGSAAAGSSRLAPIPQIASYGEASTNTLRPVPTR